MKIKKATFRVFLEEQIFVIEQGVLNLVFYISIPEETKILNKSEYITKWKTLSRYAIQTWF